MVTGKTSTSLLSRFDHEYHSDVAPRCKLFLCLTDSHLFVTVFDPVTGRIRGMEEFALTYFDSPARFADQVRLALDDSQAGQQFESIHLATDTKHCTLIPDAVFEADKCRDYLGLNFGREFSGICMNRQINQSDIQCVFHLPSELATLLQQLFKGISFTHASNIFVESALRDFKGQPKPVVLAHPAGESMSITVVENSELKLFNYYDYKSPEDLAYYIMFVVEEMGLHADQIGVYLGGELAKHDEAFSILSNYLNHLDFYQSWAPHELPGFSNELLLHRYMLPINQVRCA